MENYILTLLIFIPVLGAIIMMPVAKYMGNDKSKWVALIATFIQLLLSIWLYMNFIPDNGIQFEINKSWIEHFNIYYFIGVDGLSMPMVLLTALLSFLCIVSSWKIDKKPLGYFSLFLLLDAGMMGVFLSLDFFLLSTKYLLNIS